MERINIKTCQGYIWKSDSVQPEVFFDKEIDITLNDNENPFIIEGELYDTKEFRSYSIKFVDGKYRVTSYQIMKEDFTNKDIEHKTYLPNRMEEIGNHKLHFLRYWEPEEDANCESMKQLVITKNVFVGFKD